MPRIVLIADIPPYKPRSPIKRAIHTFKTKAVMLAALSVVIFTASGIFLMWALTMDAHRRRLKR